MRRYRAFIAIIPLALIGLFLSACSNVYASSSADSGYVPLDESELVTFRVYSTDGTREIEYISQQVRGNDRAEYATGNVQLPYEQDVLAPSAAVFFHPDTLTLRAQTGQGGGEIVCEIYLNYKLISTEKVEGAGEQVICSGLKEND